MTPKMRKGCEAAYKELKDSARTTSVATSCAVVMAWMVVLALWDIADAIRGTQEQETAE